MGGMEETVSNLVSNLVFYAQSTITVISRRDGRKNFTECYYYVKA